MNQVFIDNFRDLCSPKKWLKHSPGSFALSAFLPLMLISPLALTAEKFPTKPIQIVIPFAPGDTDNMIRPFADRMGEFLGQSVVLNFKPGAGGGIGAGGCKECTLENA